MKTMLLYTSMDLLFLILIAVILLFTGCQSTQSRFESTVRNEFRKQPLRTEKILLPDDIKHLPLPVQRYLIFTGSVGKPIPQNFRLEFDAKMVRKRGEEPMDAHSEQVNFFGDYARVFSMKASQYLIPFHALHAYIDTHATFVVRVAGVFNAVDLSGDTLTAAETVTVLNDLCLFAPGCMIDPRLTWKEIDSLTAEVRFSNGPYTVSATLFFDEQGALINFISDDRYALENDGSLKQVRWSTPFSDYREFDGRRIGTNGSTIYHYPDGDFTYGMFTLKKITYNVEE